MKTDPIPNQAFNTFRSSALLSLLCAAVVPATSHAAVVYWDGDGIGAVAGGPGAWDTTGLDWSPTSDGSVYQAWINANNDDAVFGGPTGAKAMTLGSPIIANSLTFTVSGYTITGVAANTLGSSSGVLTVDTQIAAGTTAIFSGFYAPTLGTIIKNGTGLFSSGVSQTAFNGKWIVNAGILSVAGDLRLGVLPGAVVPDQVTLDGGFLRSSTNNVVFAANRGITLGPSGGGFDSLTTTAQTWAGPITGFSGGSLIKRGTHNMILTNNANDYDGTTLVNTGRLFVGAANALGSTIAGTTVANGAGLLFDNVSFTIAEPLTISGVGLDGGALTFQNNANVTVSGGVTLAAAATVSVGSNASATFTNSPSFISTGQNLTLQGDANPAGIKEIAGVIDLGFGGVTKAQGGEWKLSANNAFQGPTFINAGILTVAANGALGTTDGVTVVASGATLGIQGDIDYNIAEFVSIAGDGVAGAGALNNISGTNAFSGVITLSADSRIGVTAGTLLLNNTVDGFFNLTKVGNGTLVINGNAVHIGSTVVSAGTLLVTGSLAGTSSVRVAGTLGGTGFITPIAGGHVDLDASGKLAASANATPLSFLFGNGGELDISAAIGDLNSQALSFELDTPASSARIAIAGGPLEIGIGVLEFDDFLFSLLAGFDVGDYVLFDGDSPIGTSLGPVTSGPLGPYTGELEISADGQDLILHVVPEPGSTMLLLGGAFLLSNRRRRR